MLNAVNEVYSFDNNNINIDNTINIFPYIAYIYEYIMFFSFSLTLLYANGLFYALYSVSTLYYGRDVRLVG